MCRCMGMCVEAKAAMLGSLMGAEDPNSGPHTCLATTLLNKLSSPRLLELNVLRI